METTNAHFRTLGYRNAAQFEILRIYFAMGLSLAGTTILLETLTKPPFNVKGLPSNGPALLYQFKGAKHSPVQERGRSGEHII